MPYKAIHRRDSWPPTILRLNEDEEIDDSGSTSSAIDEDPFSFFLSPPDDLDDDFEDLSAGIESSREKKKPKVRAVSPSKLAGRRPLLERDDDDEEAIYDDEDEEEESFVDRFGVALPISLRDFGRAHDKAKAKAKDSRRKTKEKERTNEMIEEFLFPSHKPFSSSRGRPNARLAPSRGGRGRGMTRSLPTLRQHSWREPSPDVWPIEEEIEEEEEDMVEELTSMSSLDFEEKEKSVVMVIASGAKATGVEETAPIPIPKPKKRVHWAF